MSGRSDLPVTLHEWLAVFIVDGCNRAMANAAGPFERIAERAIRGTLLGLLDEANDRFPILLQTEVAMLDRVKDLIRKSLPVLEAVASITPNTLDDEAVKFLKAWLASGSADIQAFAATYQP